MSLGTHTSRPGARGSRRAKQLNKLEAERDFQLSRKVLLDPAAAAAKAQLEKRKCPNCGKDVTPENWRKHMDAEHPGKFAPLHESDMGKVLPIVAIRRDGGTQPRSSIDHALAEDYSKKMAEGVEFDAVVVFYDGTDYWLADGFHRLLAADLIHRLDFPCDIRQGTRRDAVLHSYGANANHGKPNSKADIERAIRAMLEDPEWSQWSDRAIARHCGSTHPTVAKIKKLVTGKFSSDEPNGRPATAINGSQQSSAPPLQRPAGPPKPDSGEAARTYKTKSGTTATMDTSKISAANKARAAERRIDEPDGYVPDVPEVVVDDEWEPSVSIGQQSPVASRQSEDGQELVRPAPLFETKVKMIDTPLNGKTMAFDVVGIPIKLRPGGVYRVVFYEVLNAETPPPNPLPVNGEGATSVLPSPTRVTNVSGMPALAPVKVQATAEGQD